jgi:hypothetical protein
MTSVPFLRKVTSSLEKPKIILLDLNIDFDNLQILATKANLSFSSESFMIDIFNFLRNETKINNIDQEFYLELFIEDEQFRLELITFFKEYKTILIEIYKSLKEFKLYDNSVLIYQYASIFNETTLILHKPSEEDI